MTHRVYMILIIVCLYVKLFLQFRLTAVIFPSFCVCVFTGSV